MSLVFDSQLQDDHRRQEQRDAAVQRRMELLAQELQSHAVTVAPDDGVDISSLLAQMGRPLMCEQVMERLKKCNPRLYFERSKAFPELTGIYLMDSEGTVHVTPHGEILTIKHICGMESGIMPEFSVIHKTKTRVANQELLGQEVDKDAVKWKEVETFRSETRGWRTVLVRLLHAGLITRGDVEKHFGWTPSRDSQRWFEQTR